MQEPATAPLHPGARQATTDFPDFADLVSQLARDTPPPHAPLVGRVLSRATEAAPLSAGAEQALADNPDQVDIVLALADAPDEPVTRRCHTLASAVTARVRREHAAHLRRALFYHALSRAASVVLLAAPLLLCARLLRAPAPQPPVPDAVVARLFASQAVDGSFAPETGSRAMTPAATGLAILRLLDRGISPDAPELRAAAQWLRANQRADGSFAQDARPYNLALPALAMLKLYETGAYPELFTPIDGTVGSIRRQLAAPARVAVPDEACLAAALVLADQQGWSDEFNGDIRKSILRMSASRNPLYDAISKETTYAGKRSALLETAEQMRLGLADTPTT